jgi:hypothetical protein
MFVFHVCIWLIRVFGSYLDGRVGRADMPWALVFVRLNLQHRLPAWLIRVLNSFHTLNWLRRDVPISLLYGQIYGWPHENVEAWLLNALLHLIVHRFCYKLGEKHSTS